MLEFKLYLNDLGACGCCRQAVRQGDPGPDSMDLTLARHVVLPSLCPASLLPHQGVLAAHPSRTVWSVPNKIAFSETYLRAIQVTRVSRV